MMAFGKALRLIDTRDWNPRIMEFRSKKSLDNMNFLPLLPADDFHQELAQIFQSAVLYTLYATFILEELNHFEWMA